MLSVPAALMFALATAATASCQEPPPRTVIVASCPSSDAASVEPEEPFELDHSAEALGLSTACAKACKQFSVLGCPESRKPAGGRTCVETCNAIKTMSSFDPACVASAMSIAAVRKCPQVRCLKP